MVQSGVLVQLASVTGINRYLDILPQMTFFLKMYKRHTAFAIGHIHHEFGSQLKFGCSASAIIQRAGDLLGRTWLQMSVGPIRYRGNSTGNEADGVFDFPNHYAHYTNSLGHAMIEEAEIQIGGTQIDTHNGVFMDIWDQITRNFEHNLGENIGQYEGPTELAEAARTTQDLLVPFIFWHNKFYHQYLPIIGLQFHDVRYRVRLRPLEQLTVYGGDADHNSVSFSENICNPYLLSEFVYLERSERRFFARANLEWLIDQVQKCWFDKRLDQCSYDHRLDINHAVIEFFIVARQDQFLQEGVNDLLNYSGPLEEHTNTYVPPISQIQLVLNSHNRTNDRVPVLFWRRENFRLYHTAIPRKMIYGMSFALYPESPDPSGSCNFSHIDNATLKFIFPALHPDTRTCVKWEGCVEMYFRHWNRFKISAGMGAVRYAN